MIAGKCDIGHLKAKSGCRILSQLQGDKSRRQFVYRKNKHHILYQLDGWSRPLPADRISLFGASKRGHNLFERDTLAIQQDRHVSSTDAIDLVPATINKNACGRV